MVPQGREVARSNRRFLIRAVRYMASHGVAQFIDLGTGFPTPPSVHETAAALVDGPRVVYVDNDPQGSVSAFCSLMAPGSFLAISHITSDGTGPAIMAAIRAAYRTASAPAVFRSRGEIEGFFAGLDLVQPGIVEVSAWRASASRPPVTPAALRLLGGVGRKR